MRILVTGGTGFVGREVVRQLSGVGNKVTCLVRDTGRARSILPDKVQLHRGELSDAGSLKSALNECDAVIHLAGIIQERGRSTFEQIHVRGTAVLLKAAVEAGIKRFVHMSALGSRPDAVSRYHRTKYRAEEAVRESGMDWTIFRPSVIFGPGDQFFNLLGKFIRSMPVVPVIGPGNSRIQPIGVTKVAACFALSVGNPETYGKIYELGGSEVLTYNQVYEIIARVLGKQKKYIHVPIGMVKPGAFLMESFLPKPLITREQLIMLQEDNLCDPSEAAQEFGLEPETFEEGIRAYLHP